MRHLDLFSGIGGFALAASWAWGDEYENAAFCEIDPFCQAVLRKRWPYARIFGDIRELSADSLRERLERRGDKPELQEPAEDSGRIDLLTGGFPCQPFSSAGRRKGTVDDRHIWPEMLRVIREFRPTWVLAENVAGILSMVQYDSGHDLEEEEYATEQDARAMLEAVRGEGQGRRTGTGVLEIVMADLERLGYDVQPFVIPACAVNTPHRRDRVWIIGHARGNVSPVPEDTECIGRRGGRDGDSSGSGREVQTPRPGAAFHVDASHAEGSGRGEGEPQREGPREGAGPAQAGGRPPHGGGKWDESWLEAATRLCVVDDGLPAGLARPRGWRNAALKGAGNAIVPQVAYEIMLVIKAADRLEG